MKKYAALLMFIMTVLGAQAQNRKQVAQFPLFQNYFNPALTGHEGTLVKGFYRNQYQWTGFEGAPQTYFLSGELNLEDIALFKHPGSRSAPRHKPRRTGSFEPEHAAGLVILRDQFGPFQETQVNASFASRVPVGRTMSLRGGVALTYNYHRLNPDKVMVADPSDPEYQLLFSAENNRIHKLDVNAGVMLTEQHFYLGYAIQDLAQGRLISGNLYSMEMYPMHHVAQVGARKMVAEGFGMVFNGIVRYDNRLKETVEGQIKGVYDNMVWAGLGYRHNLALSFVSGFRVGQCRLGYSYEMPTSKAEGINASTHELMFTYHVAPLRFDRKVLSIW